MKKIIILFIAIISTLFFGCATEEDETNLLVESVSKKAILSALFPSYHSGVMHSGAYIYSVDFNYTDSDFLPEMTLSITKTLQNLPFVLLPMYMILLCWNW